MPVYHVKDSQTGLELDLRGDRPPTEAELTAIFASKAAERAATARNANPLTRGRLSGGEDDTSPTWMSELGQLLEPLAHPKTAADIGALLIPAEVPPIGRYYASALQKGREFAGSAKEIVPETIKELYRRAFPSAVYDTTVIRRPSQMTAEEFAARMKYGRPGGYGAPVPADLQADSDRFKAMRDRRVNRPKPPVEQPPAPAPAPAAETAGKAGKFAEGKEGADQLDELLTAIHGEDYRGVPNGGTPATTPPAPSTEVPTPAAARARRQSPGRSSSARRSRAASPTTPITSFEDLTDLEKVQAGELMAQGKSAEEAVAHLNAMREFRAKFNTMSPEEGERAAERNRAQWRRKQEAKKAERGAGGEDDD